ncbi:hypothetical protein [Micromonospora sp. WMMD1082]|uniref:hypothetical protein n=1 Tax=Micromonospora sp. WMMD1082 TaxID=3016104 RepID=UPI002417B7A5|nr:hypothetical protein [Micromonospora sp. WMMD1082]MDG4795733.1 hypothetical protein [Micromonospora sp. WMMD1082]
MPPGDETTDTPGPGGAGTGGGPWDWDKTVNVILGGGQSGPIDRADVTGITWIEHEATWRDEAWKNGTFNDRKPWMYNTEKDVIHFYRWISNQTGYVNDIDNIIVKVRVHRDEYLPKWQDWSHGSYLAVQPLLDNGNHPVLDRQSFVNAANSFYLVERWLDSTSAMVQRQMDGIDTEASGFSGSAAEAFHINLANLHRDLTDLHGDLSNRSLQSPTAWSTLLNNGADAIGEFNQEMRGAWYHKPHWAGPDRIIYGHWLALDPTVGPTLEERPDERGVYQAVLDSLGGNWETSSEAGTAFGLANWNVTFNLSLGDDDPELIRTVDILYKDSWRVVDELAKARWIKGIQRDLDHVTERVVPKLLSGLETIVLRTPTGVPDRDGLGGSSNNPGGGGASPPPPFSFELPPPTIPPPLDLSGLVPPPGTGGGGVTPPPVLGGGAVPPPLLGGGAVPPPVPGGRSVAPPTLGGGGIVPPTLGGGGIVPPPRSGGGAGIGGLDGPRDPLTGGGTGGLTGPVVGGPGPIRPGGLGGGSRPGGGAGGGGGFLGGGIEAPEGGALPGGGPLGSTIGRPDAVLGGGGNLGGPSAIGDGALDQIGGLTPTPFGGGLIGAAPDGLGGYQDLAKLSADTAARDLAGTSAGGSAGGPGGGYPFMPPMGGMGGQNAGKQEERERKTWLTEDEEVWGTDPGVVSTVLGREPLPDADAEPTTRRPEPAATPGSPYAPTRTETTRATRGRA